MTWDPDLYRRHRNERDRPFHELVDRVPTTPRRIADLGCGDGRLTRTLLDRWPDAEEVVGVDASPEMIDAASTDDPRLRFELADLTRWKPARLPDLIVSNAALHWVPDHARVLPHLLGLLAPGGILAVQMPANQEAPSHRAVRAVAREDPWRDRIGALDPQQVLPPAEYLDLLMGLGCQVDLWTTTYHHLLPAPDGPLDWLCGTTLRPYLEALEPEMQQDFIKALRDRLRAHYPERRGVVPFPFRRLFFVAHRPGSTAPCGTSIDTL